MKWILRLSAAILALAVTASMVLVLVPRDRIAQIAAEQLARMTGRDVQITGGIGLTLWPVVGVRAGGLEIGNAPWAAEAPMLKTADLAIGVDTSSLLRGEIRITELRADSPTIRLEQRSDGRANWQLGAAPGLGTAEVQTEAATTVAAQRRGASIAHVSITNATLIYIAEGAAAVTYSGVDLEVDWPEPAGPAVIDATLGDTATEVRASATVAQFSAFLGGAVQPIEARVDSDAGTMSFSGRASRTGAVAGRLSLGTPDTEGFLRALGLNGVNLPERFGRSLEIATEITLTPDRRLSLRDLDADLGGNRIVGAADIVPGVVPHITAQLDAGALDLRRGSANAPAPDTTAPPGGGASVSGWSTAPIDASGLAAFNGEITLSAQSVAFGLFQTGPVRAVLRNQDARLVMDLREISAYEGAITGEFVINNRAGLSVGGKLAARTIALQPLFSDAIDLDRLTGAADMDISFLGAGGSVDALMKSLSGDGRFAMGRGTVEGINLDRLMRAGDTSGGTTVFDSLTARWTISEGILRNDDLLVSLLSFEARGAGQIGLGTRTLSYRVTPIALRADSGQGVALPIVFEGPWSNVRIRADIGSALELRLESEKDKIEQRLQEEIEENLGVTVEDGQSVEDAVKDKIREKLMQKLFD